MVAGNDARLHPPSVNRLPPEVLTQPPGIDSRVAGDDPRLHPPSVNILPPEVLT